MVSLRNKIGIFILLIIVIVFYKNCKSSQGSLRQRVIIPEIKGGFTQPSKIIHKKSKKDSIVYMTGRVVYTENPFNKKLAEDFIKAQKENDSLKTLKLYLNAIAEKEEIRIFDNKDIKLEVKVNTRGDLLGLTSKYTIKEREETMQVIQKKQVFALYGGVETSNSTELNNFSIGASIGVQLKSGDIISAGYDNQKNISIQYSKQIFNIKR